MAGVLRPARIEDAAEIARLSIELGYPATVVDMRSRLALLLEQAAHRVCVVDAGETLQGWIAIEQRLILEIGDCVEVMGLVVDTNSRHSGVGRALMEEAERWARTLGIGRITVRSDILRDASHPFYERMGYVRHKTQHAYDKLIEPA
jgi:GNAT superfamily N-acetyltransferase